MANHPRKLITNVFPTLTGKPVENLHQSSPLRKRGARRTRTSLGNRVTPVAARRVHGPRWCGHAQALAVA